MNGLPDALRIHTFLLPKRGSLPSECEDAIAINKARTVFAIADGATEAYDSRSWARLFIRSWIRIDPTAFEIEDFEPLSLDLGRRLHRKWSRRNLPWYAEEKSQFGSFLAFLGLQFHLVDNSLQWRAIALGDCCLIHRNGTLVCDTFPLTRSEEFGSNPILLPSIHSKLRRALDHIRQMAGTASSGHDFLLLSDAVASWFLKQREEGSDELQVFDKLTDSDDTDGLTDFFEGLRNQDKIKNDDVAVIRIVIV